MATASNAPDVSAEELSKILSRAGVPQSVFFFVVLGVISGARKLIFKAVAESCSDDDLRCIDFTDQKAGTTLEPAVQKSGFRFTALDQQPLRVVGWGLPVGQPKLSVRASGIEIHLPQSVNRVVVRGAQYTSQPLELRAFDANQQVAEAHAPDIQNVLHSLSVEAPNIGRVILSGGGGEGLLFSVCIPLPEPTPPPPG